MPFKPELEPVTVLKKITLENAPTKLYCVWSNMFTQNKSHTMVLVCTTDDFEKYRKLCQMSFFFKS